jgi:hypothetical protein
MAEKLWENRLSILFLLIIPVLAFWQVSFFSYTMKWDIMDQFFPCRFLMSESFKEHSLPLWCPYINFGYPSYADPQGGFFYPVVWLIAYLTGYTAYTISSEFVLHIVIACFTFYLLLRSFPLSRTTCIVFALTYCLSGIFISNATHLSWVISLAWMPAVLFFFRRLLIRPGLLPSLGFALVTYLFLAGGYPGFFIILIYFLFIYGVYEISRLIIRHDFSAIKSIAGFGLLSAGVLLLLSSGYLYSIWQTIPLIERGEGLTVQRANTFPFSPAAMVSFLFPFVTACRTYATGTDITMTNAYAGLLLLPLLLFALWKAKTDSFQKQFLVFGFICLLASAGDYSFVRSWIYYLPGMNMFRHAAIFRGFAVFGFLLFAASGFDWWLQRIKTDTRSIEKYILPGFLFSLVVIFIVADVANSGFIAFPKKNFPNEFLLYNEKRNALTHLLAQCLVHLVLLGIITAAYFFIKNKNLKTGIISGLMIADMIFAAQLNISATVIADVRPRALEATLVNIKQDFVAESKRPLYSFSHLTDGNTMPIWYNVSIFKKIPAYNGFNNFQLKGMTALAESSIFPEIINHPLCFFSKDSDMKNDDDVKYEMTNFSPRRIDVKYTSAFASQIVLLQNSFPGWEIIYDGEKLPIEKAYGFFIKSRVPSGAHKVSFRFDPFLPKFFFWFTLGGFFCCAGIVFWLASKKTGFNSTPNLLVHELKGISS